MRSATIEELHANTSELMREVEDGGVIVIEREGKAVAELRPRLSDDGEDEPVLAPERHRQVFEEMREIWARLPLSGDSTAMISEDRDR